jgi:CHAD domain-containing protein
MNPTPTHAQEEQAPLELWRQQFGDVLGKFEHHSHHLYAFEDPHHIHQARVALRTITTLTGFLKSSPHKQLDTAPLLKVHTESKHILKALGKVRDFDVMLQLVDKVNKDGTFNLLMLKQALKLEQKMARIDLVLRLPKHLNGAFFELWQHFLEQHLPLHVPHIKTQKHLKKLHKKFDTRLQHYLQLHDTHGATHLLTFEALHEVRLVSKNLRYAYNYLVFALPTHDAETLETKVQYYKLVQKRLGKMNDYTNLQAKLQQMFENYPYVVNQETLAFKELVDQKLNKSLEKIQLSNTHPENK